MKDDVFNMSLRKFLKMVGITSQREIERAVAEAMDAGRIKGNERLAARMTLAIDGLGLTHEMTGEITLE